MKVREQINRATGFKPTTIVFADVEAFNKFKRQMAKHPFTKEEMKNPDKTHIWFKPKWANFKCCKMCGVVRRRDKKNTPCRGLVRVGLRAKD